VVEFEDLIGTPFRYGARPGSDSLDCYGLVMEMHRRLGIEIQSEPWSENAKIISTMMNLSLGRWQSIPEPRLGSVVLLKIAGVASHVGFCLNGTDFLHTWEASGGVILDDLGRWKHRTVGFYEYKRQD
jgi:cell wall-associated NlpC family hydrolase